MSIYSMFNIAATINCLNINNQYEKNQRIKKHSHFLTFNVVTSQQRSFNVLYE